jgi:protein-disulfide isomerase
MNEDTLDLKPAPGSADHVRGSLDAPVIVTEYADFECPYCGDAARVLDEVLARHGDAVALVFRNYPLPMHPHAEAAAEAAEAAAAAGKFWEMHDLLFRRQRALGGRDLQAYAREVGIDASAVASAVETHQYRERIERDVQSGDESGVEGTPSLFINGLTYDGEVTVEELTSAIEEALGRRSRV